MKFRGFSQEVGKIVYIAENEYREEEPVCKSCGVELEAYSANAYCDLVCPVCGYRERLPRAHPCPICGRPAAPSYCPHCGWKGEEAAYDESLPRERKVRVHLTHEESSRQLQYLMLTLQKAPDDPYQITSGVVEAVRIKRAVPPEYADLVTLVDGCVVLLQCGARYCNGRWEADIGICDVVHALKKWGRPRDVDLTVEDDCVVYKGQRYCGEVPEELVPIAVVGKCYDVRMAKLAEALGVYSASSIRRAVERVRGEKARLQDDVDSTPPGVLPYENPLLDLALCLGVDENVACAAFVEQYIMGVLYNREVRCLREGKEACRSWREWVSRRLLQYIANYGIGRKVRREVLAMILATAYAAVARGEMRPEDFKAMLLMLYKTQPELEVAYKLFAELWTRSAKYDGVVAELKKLEETVKQ